MYMELLFINKPGRIWFSQGSANGDSNPIPISKGYLAEKVPIFTLNPMIGFFFPRKGGWGGSKNGGPLDLNSGLSHHNALCTHGMPLGCRCKAAI